MNLRDDCPLVNPPKIPTDFLVCDKVGCSWKDSCSVWTAYIYQGKVIIMTDDPWDCSDRDPISDLIDAFWIHNPQSCIEKYGNSWFKKMIPKERWPAEDYIPPKRDVAEPVVLLPREAFEWLKKQSGDDRK